MVKLLDFEERLDELEKSENPFATMIAAHWMAMRTTGDPEDRCAWKLRLLHQELHMPYVTSIERRAIEQGREQGLERGLVAGRVQMLQRLLGATESTLPELITQPLESLRALAERLEQELASRRHEGS